MEKTDGKSVNVAQRNVEKLKGIFPEVFAEGKIDFDRLKELLGNYANEEEDHYKFTWHGKRKAGRFAQTPSSGTLRPRKKESVDWNATQNLFVEGDNLEVLKLLQKSYHRKIKVIYIDPPYNTGNDFVYADDFRDGIKNYLATTGQLDGKGKRTGTNSETSGRYHTDWLNMMYPRLKLARNLLKDDGSIFISIDDNEQANLKKLCDEVFGEENFVANIIWHKRYAASNDAKDIPSMHDHILVYQKSSEFNRKLLPRTEKQDSLYKYDSNDGKGRWRPDNLTVKTVSESYLYEIVNPNTGKSYPPSQGRCWLTNETTIQEWIKEGRVFFGQKGNGAPQLKRYLSEVQNGVVPNTYWAYDEVGHTDSSRKELKRLFKTSAPFDNPKPTELLKKILQITMDKNELILDFFAGSGTTAHAVMQLNAEDDGNRKFIMVQLPEHTDEKSEAYKAGYENIAEIAKERIRRAGGKIKEENPDYRGDLGFKVFKLDSSNLKRWEADFDTLENNLENALDYVKRDRSEEDLLYEIMLKYGLDLALPVETLELAGKKAHSVGGGALVVCLEDGIAVEVAERIGELKGELNLETLRVVFKDDGFADDVVKANVLQTLERYGIEDVKSL